ncbi:MAG: hypothetical protein L3J31_08140 [Bacteroidales bacterium]|nr:hypothetical protein [Bacteroidales bacterium]MCF6342757.1 hypothetical protein [Bacteroidales bacterium]
MPNPFSTATTLSAKWDLTGHAQIEIYTNAGLRVKVVMFWEGRGIEGMRVVKR